MVPGSAALTAVTARRIDLSLLDGQGLVGFLHLIATYAQPLHAAGAALAAAVIYAVMRLAYPPAR
jgi:hypothetical protein